jgi:hypothetical protein
MASQGNPGNLGKREGWETSEGARVSLLTPPVAEAARARKSKEEGASCALFPKKGVHITAQQ